MQQDARELDAPGGGDPAASGREMIYATDDGSSSVLNDDAFFEEGWLLALPDALLLEIAGYSSVQALGRAGCTCRRLRETCDEEVLWASLWEGPLPGGFDVGGKAAHAALWLLVKGTPEQVRLAIGQPAVGSGGGNRIDHSNTANSRRYRRRRVGDAGGGSGSVGVVAGAGPGRGDDGGDVGCGVATGGFPVHVSCMAINGRIIATAAGPEITVWDMEEGVPRARFNVSGHGSVTCLHMLGGTLLAGDNSGYLRCYDVSVSGGTLLHEIRTHADRVTSVDSFCLPSSAGEKECCNTTDKATRHQSQSVAGLWVRMASPLSEHGATASSGTAGAFSTALAHRNLPRQWDQGHGWGDGWDVDTGPAATAAAPAPAAQVGRGGYGGHDSGHDGGVRMEREEAEGGAGRREEKRQLSGSARAAISRAVAAAAAAGVDNFCHGDTLGGVGGGSGGGRGVGRGRGRGRGAEVSTTAGIGGLRVSVGDRGRGGGCASGGRLALGEDSWLGKRHGYAGRGQGENLLAAELGGRSGEETFGGQSGLAHYERAGSREPGEWERSRGEEAMRRYTLLFTGSDDGTAKAWDAGTGRLLCMYAGHTRGVTCLQATHNESHGDILVTGGGDSSVILWEVTTGACLEKLETGVGVMAYSDGHGPRIGCLKVFGDTILVGEDRHIAVWTLAKGHATTLKQRIFCEHQRPVRRVEMVGRWIITCSGDYVIRLWDSRTGLCVREMETKSGAAITSFQLLGLCLLTTSLFDASVLMTRFLPPPSSIHQDQQVDNNRQWEEGGGGAGSRAVSALVRRSRYPISHRGQPQDSGVC